MADPTSPPRSLAHDITVGVLTLLLALVAAVIAYHVVIHQTDVLGRTLSDRATRSEPACASLVGKSVGRELPNCKAADGETAAFTAWACLDGPQLFQSEEVWGFAGQKWRSGGGWARAYHRCLMGGSHGHTPSGGRRSSPR